MYIESLKKSQRVAETPIGHVCCISKQLLDIKRPDEMNIHDLATTLVNW